MQSLEESVLTALDGTDRALLPYLPYILQDLWEIGASPDIMLMLIKKHFPNPTALSALDLGCGKGAVSIRLASALGCACHGIDAVGAFIDEARQKARACGVADRCRFEIGDLRTELARLTSYDVILLGAIGPVLGNYFETLTALSACLKPQGAILIDDGYVDDDSDFDHAGLEKKSTILRQIAQAGMRLIDEHLTPTSAIKATDNAMYAHIEQRCRELIEKHPEQRAIFENYLKNQREENDALENRAHCATLVIKRIGE